ncbi:MAG TPA: hypothetical protein VGO55_08960 [Allosphingosinicella sp.]|jgi:hypothetical protein|nr:hypothetical protein [Allosphingosinicella sp.]
MILRAAGTAAFFLTLGGMAQPAPGPISDQAIAAYTARPYNKAAMMGRHLVLGVHNGVRVVVDFPCGDICPDYTTRIVHYDVAVGAACARARGVVRHAIVAQGPAAFRQAFCVPRVLGTRDIRLGGG